MLGVADRALGTVSVASIDGAVRRASAAGGINVLLDELALIAIAAGVAPRVANPSSVEAQDSDSTAPEGEDLAESAPKVEIRLPGDRSINNRVLVEDVTDEWTRSQEERLASAKRAEFYTLRRFLPFAHKLVATIGGEWLPLMSDVQVREWLSVPV